MTSLPVIHDSLRSTSEDLDIATALAAAAGTLLVDLRADSAASGLDAQATGRRGDLASNELILGRLRQLRPDDAILSEESADDPSRLDADRVWIIDPLDGTREYQMPGRIDWAVHVALWERGREITTATVSLPAEDLVFSTGPDTKPPARSSEGRRRVVASQSRPPAWLPPLCERMQLELVPLGSAGAKAMAVVRGDVEVYVHGGGQYEWDSAAPVGVSLAAGLHASRIDGSLLRYNQPKPYLPDLLICRPELAEDLLAGLAEVGAT